MPITLGLIETAGLSVPGDIGLIGLNDMEMSRWQIIGLTTIRQPIRDLGYAAADLLLEFGETIERRQLPHELVVRGSTAAPKG